jgi:hypothetical protein
MRASSVLKAWSAAPCFFDGRAQPASPVAIQAAAPPVIRKSRLCIVFPFQLQIDNRNDNAAPARRPA